MAELSKWTIKSKLFSFISDIWKDNHESDNRYGEKNESYENQYWPLENKKQERKRIRKGMSINELSNSDILGENIQYFFHLKKQKIIIYKIGK